MLNTSLPLEQLPHPQQLYGGGEGWGGRRWQRSGSSHVGTAARAFLARRQWWEGDGSRGRGRGGGATILKDSLKSSSGS